MFHMHPDLVGAAGFQDARYQCHIAESFQYTVMGDRFFPMITFRVSFKKFPETQVPADMSPDRACIFLYITPDQGNILAFHGMIKELFGQLSHSLLRFS